MLKRLHHFPGRAWLACLSLLVMIMTVPAQQPVGMPEMLNKEGAPAIEPRVAGTSDSLYVAWLVNDGPWAGVFIRRRTPQGWSAAERITEPGDGGRRDLQLGTDQFDRATLAWTAMEGARRRLYLAYQAQPGSAFTVRPVADEADFPALAVHLNGMALLAWQEGDGLRQHIEATLFLIDGTSQPLGRVSGAGQGLNPQVLRVYPPTVAWYAVEDLSTPLRLSEWNDGSWSPMRLSYALESMPSLQQLLLRYDNAGLMAAWSLEAAQGASGFGVGLLPLEPTIWGPMSDGGFTSVTQQRPVGDAAQPSLGGAPRGRITLAWQVFQGSEQRICISSMFNAQTRRLLIVSPVAQRFAANPDHITLGDWSAVVWVDRASDGGDGNVYLAEINWIAR